MTTDEDIKQALALVKALKQKKKAEDAKPTLTTAQKEKMQAGVVFGWSATKIAQESLDKKAGVRPSGRDVKLVRETLNSLGYKYINGKFVGKKVRLRVLPDKETKRDKLPSIESLIPETITVKKFSKKKGKKGKYRKVKRTKTQLEREGHNMNGKSCAICHDNPCPYYSRFKSQKKTTTKETVIYEQPPDGTPKQGKRIKERDPDLNRFGLEEGYDYDLKYCQERCANIKKHHDDGLNMDGTPMAHRKKHDEWWNYNWYPCAYCYPEEALKVKLLPEERDELEAKIIKNSYGNKGYHFDGFSIRAFVYRWKSTGKFIDKTVYDLAKNFFHFKGKISANQRRKEQGKRPYVKPATEIIKKQIVKKEEDEMEVETDVGIIIENNEHPEGITLSQQADEEKAKGKQEVKDSLDNAGRKTKKLVVLAKRKFSPEQLIQMAEDLRNER